MERKEGNFCYWPKANSCYSPTMSKIDSNYSSEWNSFFNWTMTYRQDSDFYTPYGTIKEKAELPTDLEDFIQEFPNNNINNFNSIEGKNKAVAWFVSNCDTPSNRMEYVRGKFLTI